MLPDRCDRPISCRYRAVPPLHLTKNTLLDHTLFPHIYESFSDQIFLQKSDATRRQSPQPSKLPAQSGIGSPYPLSYCNLYDDRAPSWTAHPTVRDTLEKDSHTQNAAMDFLPQK